jgi:outer membrane protein TolC
MCATSGLRVIAFVCLLACLGLLGCAHDLVVAPPILPEQQSIEVRDPSRFPRARVPELPPPATVAEQDREAQEQFLTLDEAIRIALANSRVVRVLTGLTAAASGRTIYDVAITNASIDQEQARFDPTLNLANTFDRNETPTAVFDPHPNVTITGDRVDGYHMAFGLSKFNVLGGTTSLGITDNRTQIAPGYRPGNPTDVFPLNPENRHAIELKYTQPLLQGAGPDANLAPVVIARLNTEISFFQFKESMQNLLQGVIAAYWSLVFARTDEWARQQQVQQGTAALARAEARGRVGMGNAGEIAQSRLALANFKAFLITAQANVLQREAALRNIMGLPPSGGPRLVPVTPPTTQRLRPIWQEIVRLAEERRPDVIELKLIIEADQQRLLQAQNNALPKVDATTYYRWNGLEGTTPGGANRSTEGGQFADWSLGVNFSVPLGLRQGRAAVRQHELIIARNWANLDQQLHLVTHDLATSTRSLAQFFAQYEANREAREAARGNLEQQAAAFRAERTIFINVLQAITDWGNAVSAEAQALTEYNVELANLERQTGTILETHGVVFHEERWQAVGPCGCLAPTRPYPSSMSPGPNAGIYPAGKEPAENFFDLKPPVKLPDVPPLPAKP